MTDTAVANVEQEAPAQHPIITELDRRLPEIEAILPEGMRIDRFRKVVVQAMLRTPGLWDCTPISLITAITEAAEVGIEPTGVLGKGWLIPYKGQAKFIPGWRGFTDLCWRADRILLTVDLVRVGDEFSYRRGTDAFLHHVPDLTDPEREAADDNVTFAYVLARFPDGREDFEVMSRVALDRIRAAALAKVPQHKLDKAIWNLHPGEMMKKTPVRRIAKRLPLSPPVQAMLARDEEVDYDTPVERVPDPKRAGLHDRITERTAALRGRANGSGESDAADPSGSGAEPEAASTTGGANSGGSPGRKGDVWMARLHAVGNERGYDHDALHEWAVRLYEVGSLTDLNPKQRGQFMAQVEKLPLLGQDCAHPPAKHVVTDTAVTCGECNQVIVQRGSDTPRQQGSRSSTVAGAATAPAEDDSPPSSAAPAPIEADDHAGEDRIPQPATGVAPGESSPAASSYTPDTLRTLAAGVLELDAAERWTLDKLDAHDWARIWEALGVSDEAPYQAWWTKQPREIRSLLMAAHQSPKSRRDAAKAATKAKPTAEQLREQIGGEA